MAAAGDVTEASNFRDHPNYVTQITRKHVTTAKLIYGETGFSIQGGHNLQVSSDPPSLLLRLTLGKKMQVCGPAPVRCVRAIVE